MSETEIGAIVKDMKQSGFPLEVVAGTRITSKGWITRHQVYYNDTVDNKSRYVDIVAHKVIDRTSGRYRRLNYTVVAECKKSEKPWVFYTPPNPFLSKESDLATIAYLREVSKPELTDFAPSLFNCVLHNHYVTAAPLDRVGVAGYVGFTGGRESQGYDQIFIATNQVLNAVQYLMEQTTLNLKLMSVGPNILVVYYPAIIFDGKMYEYILDEKEDPKLIETEYVKYEVAFQAQEKGSSSAFLIDVITKDFLARYLDILEEEMQLMNECIGRQVSDK